MDVAALLDELWGRVPPTARRAAEGLSLEQLLERPTPDANPIAWLVWHLTRVADYYIAEITGVEQIWVTDDWASRFGLEPDPDNSGYGHTPSEVEAVQPASPEMIIGYLDAVDERVRAFLVRLIPDDLDRIVDESWDPPVNLGARLVSIADDGLQHAGQAAYVRGWLEHPM